MKTSPALRASLIGLALIALTFAGRADPSCSACLAPSASTSEAIAGHPLRGVIIDILPEKQALLVTHEEIPGFMRAMTMLLKVDAPTLAAAQKGTAISGTLSRRTDGWWLTDLVPLAP